jgi:glycosyltransferase involved in cell wall biosynthesis
MIDSISPVIITFNSENTIFQTLESLKNFREIIIYDSKSTDKTVEIIHNFKNVKLFSGEFQGFGKTKNIAINFSSNSWVFSIDSDEFIDEVLVQEIKNLELSNPNIVFKLKRDNYILGKKIRFSGLGNDWLVRIFNKTSHKFKNLAVHEFIETSKNTKIVKMKNSFSHTAVTDISQFLYKIAKYSKLGSPKNKISIFHILLKVIFAFFKTYFLKLGFLDGWRGLLISVSNANGRFYKYIYSYQNLK